MCLVNELNGVCLVNELNGVCLVNELNGVSCAPLTRARGDVNEFNELNRTRSGYAKPCVWFVTLLLALAHMCVCVCVCVCVSCTSRATHIC